MSSSSQKARPRSPFLPRNTIKARARCRATQVKAQNPLPRQKPRQPQLLSSSLSPRPIYRFKRDSRRQHVIDAPRFFPTVQLPKRLPPRHSFRLTHPRRMIFRPTKNWRPHSLASIRAGNPGRNWNLLSPRTAWSWFFCHRSKGSQAISRSSHPTTNRQVACFLTQSIRTVTRYLAKKQSLGISKLNRWRSLSLDLPTWTSIGIVTIKKKSTWWQFRGALSKTPCWRSDRKR